MSSFNDSSGGDTSTQKLGSLIDSQVITHGTAAHVEEGEKNSQHHDSPDETHSMSVRRFMAFVAMAFLWTSGQMPPFLYGGIAPIIYGDIGGLDRWVWFVTANLVAFAAICPFVGALSDLLGRRYVAMLGSVLIIVGQVVCVTSHEMNPFIGGMAISGVGAGINELTAIAGTAELAPTSQRGLYVSGLIVTLLPWCPSVLWGQLISANAHWRYVGVMICAYTAIGLVITTVFYTPPQRPNSASLSARDIVRRIDYAGGLLSVSGIILLVAGILWGGYMYPWTSVHVLVPLILGAFLLALFICWEAWGAKYPMFPKDLGRAPRTLVLVLIISFISGANFFSVLMLWPTQAYNVYGHDPVAVGLRGLPFGLGVMAGCVITLALLTYFRGNHTRILLLISAIIMTAGCGSMAAIDTTNEHVVYAILIIAGLGVGGIVIPTNVITTIICRDEVIATFTALSLSIRVVGGAIGYAIYYNVLVSKLTPILVERVGGALILSGVTEPETIKSAIELTSTSLTHIMLELSGIDGNVTLWKQVVAAGQEAYASAYPWVYYCSIAFGGVSIIASFFVEDITAVHGRPRCCGYSLAVPTGPTSGDFKHSIPAFTGDAFY